MKHCFVLNPFAGKGTFIQDIKEQIEQVCTQRNADFEIYMTQAVGDATEYVKKRFGEDPDGSYRFYACGGDGTLSEVVNGVMALEAPDRVTVGLIPSGTGNDFVRNFTESERFFDIEAQLDSTEMEIDLIRCNDRYAINMVNIGFDCEVVVKTSELKRKPWLPSKMAYIVGLAVTLIRKPGVKMKLSCDGEPTDDRQFLLTTYANGCFCGGGFHSNPRAELSDGLLDALFVRNISRTRFIMLVGDYKKGTHLSPKFEKILVPRKIGRIDMTFAEETNVSVDGEVIRFSELHLSAVPRALRFLIPAGAVCRRAAPKAEALSV